MKNKKIDNYKGIDIYYNPNNAKLNFDFEGAEREVKYLFEAHDIIDEPRWESCNLEGYFIDGVFNDYIGKTKAEKKDLKSGQPYWKFQGQYDLEYKNPDDWRKSKVYPKSEYNDQVYKNWKEQKDVVDLEKRKLNDVIKKLANNEDV